MKHTQQPERLLIFSASLREESLNTRLAKLAANYVEKHYTGLQHLIVSGTGCLIPLSKIDELDFLTDIAENVTKYWAHYFLKSKY